MARYSYEAVGADGAKTSGVVDAADARSAADALRARSLFVVHLGETAARPPRPPSRRGRPRTQRLVFFLREVALMTRSGVTLLRALEVCEARTAGGAASALAARLASRIRAGRSLSQALSLERGIPPLAARLVESGEATGELDAALDRVADILERRATLRRNLLTSLAYPAIVTVVAIGVAAFLVLGVVPKFVTFFLQRGTALPWTTQALVDVSTWLRANGLHLVAGLLAVVTGLALAYRTPRGRGAIDRAALSVPVAGGLWQIASFAQISWTLGALLRSGVGLLDSLRITAGAVGNRALGDRLLRAADGILAGRTLSQGLDHPLVPPIVPSLVAAGEQAGAMTDVLGELARYYQRDLELRIRRMSSLIEPALILVVGGMVGFVYLAFFQALMQLAR